MYRRRYWGLVHSLALCAAVAAGSTSLQADDGFILSDDGYVHGGGVVDEGVVGGGEFFGEDGPPCPPGAQGGGLFGGGGLHGRHVDGPCRPWQYGNPDLFYNFYTQGICNTVQAQMYMAPHDLPPLVGHTYYTYQPLYPHEYLYKHHRRYHRYYDDGRGLNRTHVTWTYPHLYRGVKTAYSYFRIAR